MIPITRILSFSALLVALLIPFLSPGNALAHERRTVGKYQLTVGFFTEPAFTGEPNGASLAVTNTQTNEPVEGLQQTLQVEIISESKSVTLPLTAVFRQPGSYVARLIPTRAGKYAFRFFGEIEGLKIDERFESGPNTFNNVEAPANLQFPEKLPDPSEVTARLQRAEADTRNATNLSIIVGGLGIILGAAGTVFGVRGSRR